MITRDIHQLQIVPAFNHNAEFKACEAGLPLGTCTCAGGVTAAGVGNWFPGFVIDRLGLQRSFRSVTIAPQAWAEIRVSDENARFQYYGISVGLQHTCTTGGTWADYSTQEFIIAQGLWRQTTATATACSIYTAVQRDAADTLGGVMTDSTSTADGVNINAAATSTGFAWYTGPGAQFDLGGAKRYLRAVIKPIISSTACGSGGMAVAAVAVFGEADESPAPTTPVKRVLVTSGCAT